MATHVIYWDKNSPKIYPTQIATEGSDDRLMPGMTMRVEIHIEDVVDVLFVPIEAVYNREGAKYCKVRALTGMTEVEVETDRSSTDYVEITSGLRAGQEVLLHRE
jgi:HlyD family secretion protein